MSKPDWGSLQQQYIAAHSRTGISPADWCEENGLKYATARRYIKKPPKDTQKNLRNSAQKFAQKDTAQNAQKRAEKSVEKNPEKICRIIETEFQEETFNPDEFGISEQQGVFAQHVAMGKSLTDAYRLAGYRGTGSTANSNASRMLRNARVSRAIRWLRDKRQKRLALTEQEIIHQLSSIASADPNELSQVRRVNCRFCWGVNHEYQWRDENEYERACAAALKENRPPPGFAGGVGFVEQALPADDCPRCNGDGELQTFFADTTMLDGPARWLFAGVKETMNGLEVKTVSQEAARRDLARLISDANKRELEELKKERDRLENERLRKELAGDGEDDEPTPVQININVVDARADDGDQPDT